MNDPYSVLGISSSASDDDVKKAYRELARKYHPDNYHDNPLSDLAQEKMKQINEAYNTITRMRGEGDAFRPGGRSSSSSKSSPEGSKIRSAINMGDIRRAEELLLSFPAKNAEWNFLMGSVCYRKGWLNDAMHYYQTAVDMEPGNQEYRQALNLMNQGGGVYRSYGRDPMSNQGCDSCDICAAMLCMNMCCRCR